jgi:hypothetical protein
MREAAKSSSELVYSEQMKRPRLAGGGKKQRARVSLPINSSMTGHALINTCRFSHVFSPLLTCSTLPLAGQLAANMQLELDRHDRYHWELDRPAPRTLRPRCCRCSRTRGTLPQTPTRAGRRPSPSPRSSKPRARHPGASPCGPRGAAARPQGLARGGCLSAAGAGVAAARVALGRPASCLGT